jgi:hypothetical protein
MLGSVRTSKSGLVSTTKAASSRRNLVVPGCWSHFKSLTVAARLAGSSINSSDREEGECDGCDLIRLRLTDEHRITPRREGASRESKKDYLHFLYIARGSLSETQYFIHLARRLSYLPEEESNTLRDQTKIAFACLHGLIRAVEKEAGKLSKVVATITSLIVIGIVRWSSSPSSVVS